MSILSIDSEDSLLLVVDVQEKLWPHIANKEEVRDRCSLVLQGARSLGVPVLVSEQYPRGLGPTVASLRALQGDCAPAYEKLAFGCLGEPALVEAIEKSQRRCLVVCGIEAHVCVLQTVLGALGAGLQAAVVADAVGSRHGEDRRLALDRMKQAGAILVSAEMILFEWLKTAGHPAFKAVSALIKQSAPGRRGVRESG